MVELAGELGLAKGTVHGLLRMHMGSSYLDGNELRTRALNWSDALVRGVLEGEPLSPHGDPAALAGGAVERQRTTGADLTQRRPVGATLTEPSQLVLDRLVGPARAIGHAHVGWAGAHAEASLPHLTAAVLIDRGQRRPRSRRAARTRSSSVARRLTDTWRRAGAADPPPQTRRPAVAASEDRAELLADTVLSPVGG